MDECEQFFEGVSGDDLAIPIQLIDANGIAMKIGAGDGMTDIVGEFTNGSGLEVQVKYSLESVTLVDSTCGRALLVVAAAVSATLKTDRVKRQTFSVYTIINGKQQTWIFDRGLLLKPRPVPSS